MNQKIADDPEESVLAVRPRSKARRVAKLNLVAGVILWFGYFTDYSWPGSLLDFCYPPLVTAIALGALMKPDKGPTPKARRFYKWACVPSLAGGGLAIAMTLSGFKGFWHTLTKVMEWSAESEVASVPSPDGCRTARVDFRRWRDGAGHGTAFVRLGYRWLPFIERELYTVGRWDYGHRSYGVAWKNDETLTVSSYGETLDITPGVIRLRMPQVFVWIEDLIVSML